MSSEALVVLKQELEDHSSELRPKLLGYRKLLCGVEDEEAVAAQLAIDEVEGGIHLIDNAVGALVALEEAGYPWGDRVVDRIVLEKLRDGANAIQDAIDSFHSIEVKAVVSEERPTPKIIEGNISER